MIVVGINKCPAARDALALGRWLGAAHGEDLLLVWVRGIERPPGKLARIVRAPILLRRRLQADAIENAVRALAHDTATALPPGLRSDLRMVEADSPASGLARVVQEERPSMLVLGASERAGVGRIVPGSTALRLLSGDSSVPVAIAPRDYVDGPPRGPLIGVGFDGGPEAGFALASADRLARAVGGRLRVVAVHKPAAFSQVGVGALASESVAKALRRELRSEVEQAVAECCETRAPETIFLRGDPATELTSLSAELDVLFLGSRGHGPVRSVLLGSVSEEVVAGSRAPVVVVPRAQQPQQPTATNQTNMRSAGLVSAVAG